MLELWRSRRAITPVLSNVLLMVIAVAGMSIAITATYVITDNLHETMGERFIVEDVWFRADNTIDICLYNNGKTALDISAIYVNHASTPFTPLHLEPQDHGWLNVTCVWAPNATYYINIATNRGTKVGDYYKP
jgi:hypothetical protein